MKGAIQSLDLSYLLHATEDPETVSLAVRGTFTSNAPFETEEMEGHFGNTIKKVDLHLHGEEATRAFHELASKLPATLKSQLARDMDKYVDEHSSLFLRLDKQKLVKGELALGTNDVIRLKVKPRVFVMKGHGREFFANLLGEI
jgi:RNA binding exosome subunit